MCDVKIYYELTTHKKMLKLTCIEIAVQTSNRKQSVYILFTIKNKMQIPLALENYLEL